MKITSAQRNGLLIVISIGLGCLSAWAIEQHLSAKEQELEQQSRIEKVIRIVAARDLPRGTLVSLKDFAKDEFPANWIGADAVALSDAQLVQGKQLNIDLKAGQLLMHVHLVEQAQPALASRLSHDKRAVTIPVDLMSSMSGLLQPGDRVDLFVSFEYKGQRTTASLLQGIEVLATGQQTKMSGEHIAANEVRYSTVTLAASHEEAKKLVAARQGGGDLSLNPRLRLAIEKAKAANMPADNIKRNVDKATGNLDGVVYEEIRYEGYGVGGAAIIVDTMTDNRVRTVAEVRFAFSKNGGNMGTEGSVAFQFKHCGQLVFAPGSNEDQIMEIALEAGADDVITDDDGAIEVLTPPASFEAVKNALEAAGLKPEVAEVTYRADNTIELEGDDAVKMQKILDALEDLDDVQEVYHNAAL